MHEGCTAVPRSRSRGAGGGRRGGPRFRFAGDARAWLGVEWAPGSAPELGTGSGTVSVGDRGCAALESETESESELELELELGLELELELH